MTADDPSIATGGIAVLGGNVHLARDTLADRVTTQLRQLILSGRFGPGDQLPTERELCQAFGVSRATIREGLHGLVASGFLVRSGKQLLVKDRLDIPEEQVDYAELAARTSVEDVFETRKALESKAIELTTDRWSGGDMTLLRARLEALRDVTGAEYHAADVAFHTTIVQLSGNAILEQVYADSKHLFFRLPSYWRVFAGSASAAPPAPIRGYDGHRPVVDAIERRDADEAVRRNTELLDAVAATLVARLRTGS